MPTPHRIITIVSSAGGFEPLADLIAALSGGSGSAFIVLQHAAKSHESLLATLLGRRAHMPVQIIENDQLLEADHVYVGPPGLAVSLVGCHFVVTEGDEMTKVPLFDGFLQSLAQEWGERAVVVVLSGAGSDAKAGSVAVRQAGGVVLVQDPVTAEYRSMPEQVAVNSAPDAVLAPVEMARLLERLARAREDDQPPNPDAGNSYRRILELLHRGSGIDFSRYKPATINRRIARRMLLNGLDQHLGGYVKLVESSTEELSALSRDLLIGVSSFLRDPDMYRVFSEIYLPELLRDSPRPELRLWVAGCAQGEEAYSFAMVILEYLRTHDLGCDFRILASDINPNAIAFANRGIYPESVASEIPAEWLARYFDSAEQGYRVKDIVRRHLVFFRHDMTQDIPFTNVDVVSCRNVFIYFNSKIQSAVTRAFGFALRLGGLLILSPSESLGSQPHFVVVNDRWRIHRLHHKPRFVHSPHAGWRMSVDPQMDLDAKSGSSRGLEPDEALRERLLSLLAERFVPLILVVSRQGEILYILGDANNILRIPSGEPGKDLSRLLDPALRLPIQSGLKQLSVKKPEVELCQVPVRLGSGADALVNLRLVRVPGSTSQGELVAVLFERIRPMTVADCGSGGNTPPGLDDLSQQRICELEEELYYTQQNLRTAIEELEATNEELQAANEEMQAGNEELQSANEELQSTNEELATLNTEYQEKARELAQLNDDINNLMTSAEVATIFIDGRELVRLISPTARKILPLSELDQGRPMTCLKNVLSDLDVVALIRSVLTTHQISGGEARLSDGRVLSVRAHPFRAASQTVSGVVLNLIDITELRRNERDMRRLAAVFTHSNDAIILMDARGLVVGWNGGAERMYGWTAEETRGLDYRNLLPDPGRAQVDTLIARLNQGETQPAEEAQRLCRDGRLLDVWVTYTGIYDTEGHLLEVATIEQDISDKVLLEREMRLAAVAFESVDGIMVTDRNACIVRVNRAFTEITGFSEADVLGKRPTFLQSGRQSVEFYRRMWDELLEKGFWQGEIWNRNKAGEIYPEWLAVNAVKNRYGAVTHYIGVFRDIREKKAQEAEIHKLAFYDSLTGLPNRRLLLDRLELSIEQCRRERTRGALLFLDLDRFKTINDSLGHSIGDLLLQKVAYRLRTSLRTEDTVARLGGDEFVIMLNRIGRSDQEVIGFTEKVSQSILHNVDRTFDIEGHALHTTVSIGVTLYPDGEDTVEDLLRQADNAMYLAKKKGRNRAYFFDPSLQAAADAWLRMERDLRRALTERHFQLHYQPLVTDEGCIGAEALIRWSRDGVAVPPGQFIPICEETGIIIELGRWVLKEACQQFKVWLDGGMIPLRVLAVNISPLQFNHEDFVGMVSQIVRETGMDPHHLELEVTESLLLDEPESVIEKMDRLKTLGIRFSIDDFGTGYSSLAYIKRLPIDKIKIDRAFVRDLLVDEDTACIVEAIIAMAQKMQLELVAEGVESVEQVDRLIQLGCGGVQGFLFAHPLSADRFPVEIEQIVPLTKGSETCPGPA